MLRSLTIQKLERAAGDVESYRRGGGGGYDILKNKTHLSRLACDSVAAVEAEEEMKKKRIEEVFELLLCPPPGLEYLRIRGYYGINFPSWIMASSVTAPSFLPNLRKVQLADCIYCGILPPLGNLPNLEFLTIGGARSVIAIGAEFLGADALSPSSSTCSVHFPKLTYLEFINMPNWEKWEWEEENTKEKNVASMSVLPRLIEIKLIKCPKLRSLPVGLAQNANSLNKMVIIECDSLVQVSGFHFLKELTIRRCPNLESISGLPSLQQLELIDYEMERLPEWLLGGQQQFPALRKLQIWSSIGLLRRCLEVDSSDWPKIQHFPRVYGLDDNTGKYFSYTRNGGPKPSFNTNILDDDE